MLLVDKAKKQPTQEINSKENLSRKYPTKYFEEKGIEKKLKIFSKEFCWTKIIIIEQIKLIKNALYKFFILLIFLLIV